MIHDNLRRLYVTTHHLIRADYMEPVPSHVIENGKINPTFNEFVITAKKICPAVEFVYIKEIHPNPHPQGYGTPIECAVICAKFTTVDERVAFDFIHSDLPCIEIWVG